MGGMNVRGRNDYYPEYDDGQDAGGLLDLLHAVMQQGQAGPGVNSGSTPNGSNNDDTPQGRLLGRLLAMMGSNQAEAGNANSQPPGNIGPIPPTRITVRPFDAYSPYDPGADRGNPLQEDQAIPPDSGQALSGPRNPNFRQLSRVSTQPQGAIGPSDRSDNQSGPPYPFFDDGASLDFPRVSAPSGQAPQPDRSLSDRIQASWDHPHPYGLLFTLKEALNGIAQAVQGSIDATSVPSTEEEAFRQNVGREQGPIGAWRAAKLLAPLTPASAGRAFMGPLADAIVNRLPSLPAAERMLGRSIEGPTFAGFPTARVASGRNVSFEAQNPIGLATGVTSPASVLFRNSARAPLQPSGGSFSAYTGKPLPPLIAAALAMNPVRDRLQEWKTREAPMEPVATPPIPVPTFREWLAAKGKTLKESPSIVPDIVDNGDDGMEGCDKEIEDARNMCTKHAANGWRDQMYDSRRKKRYWKNRTVEDCVRENISERCGGNPVDYGDKGKGRKK